MKIGLKDFEDSLTEEDKDNLEEIAKETIQRDYKHTYKKIIMMNFYPFDSFLFLYGRHKYQEHKRFNSEEQLEIVIVNSNDISDCIITEKRALEYEILCCLKDIKDSFGI